MQPYVLRDSNVLQGVVLDPVLDVRSLTLLALAPLVGWYVTSKEDHNNIYEFFKKFTSIIPTKIGIKH